ncbi:MAG: hypothetical protein R3321_15555, partial [Nitrososphaeraceae archaeon]|nr:hypothetical protein [Nitrososphaeraceae archaeon]
LTNLKSRKNNEELLTLFNNISVHREQIQQILGAQLSDRALQTIHAELRYGPYMEREARDAKRVKQQQQLILPANMHYTDMPGLSKELQQKLNKYKPHTIAQAALIPGMTPAALSLLIFKIRQQNKK